MAEGGNRCEDDVGLHRRQALVVEAHRFQRRGRQVRHHDVCRGDETAYDAPAGFRHWIEGETAFVAVHLQEHRAFAALAGACLRHDRLNEAVFRSLSPFDPDNLGTQVAQKGRAVRPGNIAAEVEHANALENPPAAISVPRHDVSLQFVSLSHFRTVGSCANDRQATAIEKGRVTKFCILFSLCSLLYARWDRRRSAPDAMDEEGRLRDAVG